MASHGSTVRSPPMKPAELEAYKENMYKYFSDPGRVGRGAWMTFIIAALHADTEEELMHTCKIIRNFCRFFKCGECHGHCTAYIEKNPPEPHVKVKDGLFMWIVEFMSAVNVRTGRPAYDPSMVRHMFVDDEFMVCSESCGQHSTPKPTPNYIIATDLESDKTKPFAKISDSTIEEINRNLGRGILQVGSKSEKPGRPRIFSRSHFLGR